jgi:hypothetical protein
MPLTDSQWKQLASDVTDALLKGIEKDPSSLKHIGGKHGWATIMDDYLDDWDSKLHDRMTAVLRSDDRMDAIEMLKDAWEEARFAYADRKDTGWATRRDYDESLLGRRNAERLEAIRRKLAEEVNPEPLKVGDILVSSWGYDQTNVDFYQVVAVSPKGGVTIREIGKEFAGETGGPSEKVVAVPNSFTGPPMKKRPTPYGSVKISSYARAFKWDGKPAHQTGAAYGH